MKAFRPIGHEDQLSIIDHLDELRSRLIACGVFMLVVFGLCFWQNTHLLSALNRALPTQQSAASHNGLGAQSSEAASEQHAFRQIERGANQLSAGLSQVKGLPATVEQGLRDISSGAAEAAKTLPTAAPTQVKPVALGVGESFTVTLMVVGYFTLLISLPMLLYQLYAFVIPALSRRERRIAIPAMLAAPLLFVAGAVFTYFMVLPPAVHFLQGYNASQFQILPQAKAFYKFEILLMLGIGLSFQVPLLMLALQRAGVITSKTLTLNWRYAVVLIAVAVAALPGVDPVTMFFETLPLVVLYLASIVLLKVADHRDAKREAEALKEPSRFGGGLDAT